MAFIRYGDYSYKSLRFVDHCHVPWESKDDIMVCPEMRLEGLHLHFVGWPEHWSVFIRFQE